MCLGKKINSQVLYRSTSYKELFAYKLANVRAKKMKFLKFSFFYQIQNRFFHFRSTGYKELLHRFNLATLVQRRKLLNLFILPNSEWIFHFPDLPVAPQPMDPRLRSYSPFRLGCSVPHTLAYSSSFFFPETVIKLWNSVSNEIPSLSLYWVFFSD